MKRLNIKLLVWLFVTPAILAIGIHFLHAYQIDRNAGSLKAQAEEAARAGDSEAAIGQYTQYLKHRGNDPQAYGELARLTADVANKPDATLSKIRRAYAVMEEASRRHPELVDVRKRLIDYCMKLGRFRDATDHIDRLRADGHGKGTDFDIKYAQCLLVTGRDEKAVKLLSEVVGFDPMKQEFKTEPARGAKEVDAYVLLAEVYRKQADDSKDAETVIGQLVKANPESAKAHAERGRFHQRQKKFDEANASLTRALELSPKDADIVISAAEVAAALNDLDRANQLLTENLKEHPKDERIYRALASLALQQKKPDDAMKYVEAGLKQAPSNQYLLLFRADLELQKGDIEGVSTTLKQMRESEFLPELIEYIECRILIAERKWLNATRQLERLRPLMARFPDLTMQIDLLLGQCYQSRGQPDRSMDAFLRALDSDPTSVPAQLGYAQALREIGKSDAASEILSRLKKRLSGEGGTVVGPVINQQILQTTIADELRKPEAKRDWTQVDLLLEEVLKGDTLKDSQKAVLQAEILMLKKDYKQARGVLSAAVKKYKNDLAVWLGLLNLVSQDKDTKYTTEDILDRAEKAVGPVIQLKQIRLAHAVRKQGKEAKEEIKKIEADLGGLNDGERAAFLGDLGNAYYRLRDYENARRCWLELAKARPEDSKILLTLFQLAKEFGAEADMDASLEDIRKSEQGASSSLLKFCEAEKAVWQVRQKKAELSTLSSTRKQLDEARKRRPEWHEIARLSAEIYELEGKADDAIVEYQRALELGPPDPNTARRLVALLYLRGRISDVDKAMSFIPNVSDLDPLRKIQIEMDARQGKLEDALADAKKVVEAEPQNSTSRLWYGQLLSRAGRDEEAQQAYRDAVKNDPKSVQGWLSLVAHLVSTKQLIDAQAVIREAKEKLPADVQNAFLAQSYERVGDKTLAEENYRAMLAKKPKDLGMMRMLAAYYLRTDQVDKGREQLSAILAQPAATDPKVTDADRENIAWARRGMAQIVAQQGDYHSLQDAIKMLEANRVKGKMPPEDMLLAAGMLAKRPDYSSRVQALKWLEQVQAERTLSPDEQFVMAHLYEETGDWSKARDTVVNVLAKVESNVALASAFAQMLIKHDELVEAERWVDKVETAQPNTPLAIQLRARLLAKQGNADQAATLLMNLVDSATPETRLQTLAGVAALLEEFEQFTAAEEILRNAVGSFPRAKIALGAFIGRHGDLDEAFALYEDSRKSYPLPTVIQSALETLRRRSLEAHAKHFAKATEWLKSATEEDPKSLNLQLQQAELYDIQGRTSEVISAYRQMLASKDLDARQRAVVHNNLAFVLAMNGGSEEVAEGLRLINESIDVLGPSSDLLDTRAVCFLAQGNTKRALEDLQSALIESPSPVKYIHLATAELKSGDKAAAAKSLEKARALKLDINTLSSKERENYEKLSRQLESK